ncbi:hypothetical protein [Zobellia laminariae]|uniref:hypothetical protein n=1 Tax=Zobellia laminariae TaxID=248906 RepID=UPI0026F4620D|nr:hypothetical protein [Zobellia laminariae]WKX76332.1 hypothetical protein Q5W13_22755 [Zobellia laminariae]
MSYKRIAGGEKNLKSGQRWTKDEIIQVYHLYKKLNGVGLHENNPEIQFLAQKLERTVRSTEAQTLMFRSLERLGNYSHGNMNKLSQEVWNEYELQRNSQISISFEDVKNLNSIKTDSGQETLVDTINSSSKTSDYILIDDEINDCETYIYNYIKWNKLLVDYFFNSNNEGEEIECFFVYRELFEEISDSRFNFSDFELSIERLLRVKSFKDVFNKLYFSSSSKIINGRNLRKPLPEYFGLLIYLILCLSESKSESLSINNVYDRINDAGKERFNNKWGDINTSFARDILELAWIDLEDWSKNYKAKKLGYFSMKDPKSPQRKYVSRIERHGLFNSHHFQQLFDVLVEIGIVPKEEISPEKWLEIFRENKHKINNSDKILDYLREDSELKEIILKFINDYYLNHFDYSIISSHSGTIRKPSIPLLFCLKELPQWDDVVGSDEIHFRAFSSELEEDVVSCKDNIFNVEHEYKEYSKKIKFNWVPNQKSTLLIKGNIQRFSINCRPKWLVLNRDLEEWVEVITPTNALIILLLVDKEKLDLILREIDVPNEVYKAPWQDYYFIEFENLSEIHFKKLTNLLGYRQKIEGKIEIIGNFLLNRRRLILKEFDCQFKYYGPVSTPELVAKCKNSNEEFELIQALGQSEGLFEFSCVLRENTEFFIYEKISKITSHFSFTIGSLKSRDINNIVRPYSKNEDGVNIIEREIQSNDIFDIPNDFNKIDFNVTNFNTWHKKLWYIFKPTKVDYITKNNHILVNSENHKGENLLKFLSVVNTIDTYKFPSLIRELNPKIDAKFGKRIMHYWRDLGYINFESYGERIKVSPSNLLFIETEKGLRAFLTGFRNQVFMNKLVTVCTELNLIIKLTSHSEKYKEILPIKIEIYDKLGDLDKFKILAERMGIKFINNIENPFNSSFAIYQLACFYTQRSVDELDVYLNSKLEYHTDHHRKLIFEPNSYIWKETNQNVSSMESPALIRYDGFKDRQVIHIYKDEFGSKILDNYALASFKLIEKNVFLRKYHHVKSVSDFYVPLNMSLPFWIERGLVLINAQIPVIEWIDKKAYRKYQNIHDDIIEIIEFKLNQKTTSIK